MVVSGVARATYKNDSWDVEVAEMLPDGVELKTPGDNSLKLIHLGNDMEYLIEENSTVIVDSNGITGSDVSGKEIKLLVAGQNLGNEMNQQTGAAELGRTSATNIARNLSAPLPDKKKKESDSLAFMASPSADESVNEETKKTSEPESGQTQNYKADDNYDKVVKEQPAVLMQKPKTDLENENNNIDTEKYMELPLAIPGAIAESLIQEEDLYKYEARPEIVLVRKFFKNDWLILVFEVPQNFTEEIKVTLKAKEHDYSFDLLKQDAKNSELADALKLERLNKNNQAAGLWCLLASRIGISDEALKVHLNRIKEKLDNK
ncbi:MAG: hypothetical protein Kow0029_27760 [Candidatus Rifleibacteriota bacterium]